MGLGYTIDTPLKVARFGITSVVSIIQDHLVEQMREFHCKSNGEEYNPIPENDIDHRAKRITAYLNLLNRTVEHQVQELKKEPFAPENDIAKYFQLLPESSPLKALFVEMTLAKADRKLSLQNELRENIKAGAIDVNIMTKLDNLNYTKKNVPLPAEYADAMAALRGYANSDLASSIVFSAGLNPRLFAYAESFDDFFPNANGYIKKQIILKVSDYRSALIQGKFLAKKGLWVSEFRIESGLNCGGHAFPTDGHLLGPILEEFRNRKDELSEELRTMCNKALQNKNRPLIPATSKNRLTVQGGIGTANEDGMLMEHYKMDGTGWGSPFLMVPEATTVDDKTLQKLAEARMEDYYLSHASPLGVPFNNFRQSSSEEQRKMRINKNRPGSPCYLNFLAFNTEFKEKPICVSSREYQHRKLKELDELNLPKEKFEKERDSIMEKDCLCEGLSTSVLLKNGIPERHGLEAVTICPGPNLAYFSSVFSLREMVDHIYGRANILNLRPRKHMFLNELKMYIDYLRDEWDKSIGSMTVKKSKHFSIFKTNLLDAITYYKQLTSEIKNASEASGRTFKKDLKELESSLLNIISSRMTQAVLIPQK